MDIKNKSYDVLLARYCGDDGLIELLRACILDEEDTKEAIYRVEYKYPEERNLILKLKYDLIEKRKELSYGR